MCTYAVFLAAVFGLFYISSRLSVIQRSPIVCSTVNYMPFVIRPGYRESTTLQSSQPSHASPTARDIDQSPVNLDCADMKSIPIDTLASLRELILHINSQNKRKTPLLPLNTVQTNSKSKSQTQSLNQFTTTYHSSLVQTKLNNNDVNTRQKWVKHTGRWKNRSNPARVAFLT